MKEEAQLLTQACGEKAHKIIVRYHIEFDPVVRPQIFRKSTTVKSFAEAVGDISHSLSLALSLALFLSLSFVRIFRKSTTVSLSLSPFLSLSLCSYKSGIVVPSSPAHLFSTFPPPLFFTFSHFCFCYRSGSGVRIAWSPPAQRPAAPAALCQV